jgi:N-acetylneuraminate synthase/N,N'-diacetyllegionaminate synthase
MNYKPVRIGNRFVGPGYPVFVIAEIGVNHNGDLELARQLITCAAEAGADAVKFQSFKAERLVTETAPKAAYQLATTDPAESQKAMLDKLELSADAHKMLRAFANTAGVIFLSTPFDEESADLLEELGVPAFKVSSGDLTNVLLLEHIAKKRRPTILSTGMATLEDVAEAVEVFRSEGTEVIVLHCVTNYPAEPGSVNLRAMRTLESEFQVPIGYSDHTAGNEVTLAAVALGATVIEKHLTLDRNLPGPDHRASIEPAEFRSMISGIRNVEASLGDGVKRPTPDEIPTALIARRSLASACSIPAGTVVNREMITARRPGTGLKPSMLKSIVGRRARVDIAPNEIISLGMFEPNDEE